MVDVVDLYRSLRTDGWLPKEWERSQPRTDRALQAVL
jgi:hypothetical protein